MRTGKRLLSLITAVAIAISSFASFAMTASAEDTVVNATLVHTAAAQGGSNEALTTLDTETHYVNNWGTSGWVGTGYTEFSFADTEVNADTASRIKNATLTFQTNCARGTRPLDVGLLDSVATAAIDFTVAIDMIAKPATIVASYSDITTDYVTKTVDVTDVIKARVEAGDTRFIFAYANAAAGGNIYGKGAAEANWPTLSVTMADASAVERTITINYVDGDDNVIKTETDTTFDGLAYTFEGSTADFDADDKSCRYIYNAENSTTSIAAVSEDDCTITIAFDKVDYASITVNNVVDEDVIKSYTDTALVGSTYNLTDAQLGYKLVEGVYYFAAEDTVKSYEVEAGDNVFDVVYEATTEQIALYEDFGNIADTWGVVNGKDTSVAVSGGALKLTQYNATSGTVNEYGYLYSDVKEFDSAISAMKQGTIVVEWASDVEGNKNRKNAFEILDSDNNVILGLQSQAGKGSTDTLEAGVTYQVGGKATDASTNIAGSGWSSGNSGTYTITLNFDFTGETGKVSGSIKGGVANADITIEETEVAATNIAKLVASDVYSLAPQSVYSVKVVGEAVEPATKYAVTVAETTNGIATADKAEAAEGEEVTITATAAEGYEVDTITAKAADDTDVTVTDGKFTMPAQAVTVTVTFKEVVTEPTPASVNLITNGDFTNGFADWTNAADGGVYDGTISENADYIHGDGKAITNKVEAGGNAASTLRRYIPVEGGKTYNLSFYAYNTGEQNTINSFMSAFVPVVVSEPVFGSFNGITFKDYVAYGGQNSWSEEPQSEVNQKRQDIVYQAGMNHIEYEINTPEDANYIMISLFAWTPVGRMYFSDFELYEATPEPTTYAVTVEEAENGTVTADMEQAAEGTKVTLTVDPAEGYELATLTVTDADGEAVTVADDNTFVMPAKAVTVAATFKETSTDPVEPTAYAVTVATATNGTVTVDKATAEAGATVTITATANDGYEVDTITVTDADGAAVTVANNAFTMPAKAVTVTVTFKATETPVDPKAVIDFTNRTLTYESKGSTTVFEVSDATAAGATALAAAGAGNVLKLGSSQNGGGKMLGYKADFAKEGENTVVYGDQATVSFKLEPMQVRTDKEASIELSFADINGNKILPITVGTGMTASLTVNGQAANGIAYGNYYVVTYTMDFAAKTASVTIDAADGTNCLTISDAAITAENITQLYRADSDWLYGYCAIDDIAIDATEIGVPVFYSIVINTERYAKLTTADGAKYFADVNGKIEIPLQKPGTAFDYTLSKVGYDDVTGTVEALTGDFEDTKPMTKSSDDVIFIESEFGNANEAYVSAAGSRNDSISLGSVALPEMSEITVDLNFAGIATEGGSHKTWALVTDGGAMVGIQFNLDGIYAWTGWTGNVNWNQSSDVGAYTVSERLGDLTTGDMTFKFVVDTKNKAVTVSYGDVSKSLTYAVEATALTSIQTGLYRNYGETRFNEIRIEAPDENYLAINGVSGVAKISGQTIERTYGLSQTVIVPDETFTWTVADAEGNAIEGVTIENGVLKVADTATPSTAVITCVGSSSADKVATFNVTIGDFQQVALVIDGPQSYDVTETSGQYTAVSAVDSFGDEVKDLVPAVVWTSSDDTVVSVDAATGEATVVGAGSATITATITNGTAVSTATIPVTVATYYVVAEATGDSTVVDISGLVNNAAITGYQVTTIKDGAIVNQTVVAKADVNGTITSTTTAAAAGEKIVATYDENGAITNITATAVAAGDEIDLTAAEGTKVFFWNSLNGMAPVATATKEVMSDATITVDTTGADSVEIAPVYQAPVGTLVAIPAATYNITVTANNGARTDVYANEQMLINNLNQGSDNWTVGRVIAGSTDYVVEDIVIDQGYVKFKMYDDKSGGTTVTKVVFAKVPDGVTRAKRIYTIGDSLVAAYYGAAPEGKEGLVRTGWGQVFDKFVTEDAKVTNLGNSGAEAVGMLGAAFTNVKESAKAGDIVVWESGYNDRSYSTVDNMKAAITEAYEYCVANDIEFYVVNPNASSHDYNASVVWAQHIRDLAADTEMPLIDLSQKSYDFLNGMYADVADVHALLQTYYNNTGDTLHSSYNAANCWAAIVAQGLYDAGHTDIINTEYLYTFNDGIQDVTVQVVAGETEETPAE